MVGPPACLHVLIYAHSPGCPAVGHPWRLLDFALEATPLHVAITDRLKPLRNERVSSLFFPAFGSFTEMHKEKYKQQIKSC